MSVSINAYSRVVEQVLAQLGESVQWVVLSGDNATLLVDGGEQREPVIPARDHELKALAHLALGVQLTLTANGTDRLTELTASELHERREQIREAQAAVNNASSSAMMKASDELLCCARALVDRVLAEGAVHFERLPEHVRAMARMPPRDCATGQVRPRWRGRHRQVAAPTAPQI